MKYEHRFEKCCVDCWIVFGRFGGSFRGDLGDIVATSLEVFGDSVGRRSSTVSRRCLEVGSKQPEKQTCLTTIQILHVSHFKHLTQ